MGVNAFFSIPTCILGDMNRSVPEYTVFANADENIYTKAEGKHNARIKNEENKECEKEYRCD